MKPIKDLDFGFNDATMYKSRSERERFRRTFFKTEALDDIFKESTFFLVGEKGTGKTSYAVYISISEFYSTRAFIVNIGETEYRKFITLKQGNRLEFSDYEDIWRVILYYQIANRVKEDDVKRKSILSFSKLAAINKAIAAYERSAFQPEALTPVKFLESQKRKGELNVGSKDKAGVVLGAENSTEQSTSIDTFNLRLLSLKRDFETALGGLSLKKNYLLFIDGIDTRPESVSHDDYIECLRGLASAVWSINTEFFVNIKDSEGRMRVVLMVRPDVFSALRMNNFGSKITDCSVMLDWFTNRSEYRKSNLFGMIDNLIGAQQEPPVVASRGQAPGAMVDSYLPPFASNGRRIENADKQPFARVLDFTFFRPRDVVTAFRSLKELAKDRSADSGQNFQLKWIDSPEFRRKMGAHLLREIKDALQFYYSEKDYNTFRMFFNFLNGKTHFNWAEFEDSFEVYSTYLEAIGRPIPGNSDTAEKFLQMLFTLNIIGCMRQEAGGKKFWYWCYRERSLQELSPAASLNSEYQIHSGVAKELNLGADFEGP